MGVAELKLPTTARPLSETETRIRLDRVADIDAYLREANGALAVGAELVVWAETHYQVRRRLQQRVPGWAYHPLLFGHFVAHRVLPRLSLTRGLHAWLTGRPGPVLSLTEVLGRLIYAGFEVVSVDETQGLTRVVARKVQEPMDRPPPQTGPFVTLTRVGKDGATVRLHKLRTMHPYAEFLQGMLQERNGLLNGDKIRDDFRVTTWGRFLRRHFLDELPMLVNLLRGDLKLVGVRPLSPHKLRCYSRELQERRLRHRPGLIPPYYADLPQTLEEMQASEWRYLERYERAPFATDLSYLVRAVANIVFRGARSR